MYISTLTLSNFRCHSERTCVLSPRVTIVSGDNASGKTSVLEALYMLSRGSGFREVEEVELLTSGRQDGYIMGDLQEAGDVSIESTITYVRSDDRLLKHYLLNKSKVGLLRYRRAQKPVVLFAPQMIDIIVHGPSYRREYLDSVLSGTDPVYAQSLREYGAGLRTRNKILEDHTDATALRRDLEYWDIYLEERAAIITSARAAYTDYIAHAREFAGRQFAIQYLSNPLTRDRLHEKFGIEMSARRTVIGPQKDDFVIILTDSSEPLSVHAYASRSQQRIALLWIKMREISYITEKTKEDPLVLLDDMFSELDSTNRRVLTSLIPDHQTVITTTDDEVLSAEAWHDSARIDIG